MESPIQVRFQRRVKNKLSKTRKHTGIAEVDVVRLAVDQLFERYANDDEIVAAVINWRTAKAKETCS